MKVIGNKSNLQGLLDQLSEPRRPGEFTLSELLTEAKKAGKPVSRTTIYRFLLNQIEAGKVTVRDSIFRGRASKLYLIKK